MFTGLVEYLGTVRDVVDEGPGTVLLIEQPELARGVKLGGSVAVNGVCLTVVAHDGTCCRFQAGPETLRLTNLGELRADERVNLERPVRLGDELGGHLVQGHVDGLGTIVRRERHDDWEQVWFACPAELARFLVAKGSIAVDGVSLTLVDVAADSFSVALIPHTLAVTTLGIKTVGARVNLEVDLFAKYVWKFLANFDLFSLTK